MATISAADVKTLRDRTNAPMMDCKAALTEAGGDMEKAVENIRKKFSGIKDKKADRETAEGRIAIHRDDAQNVAAIVELRCESAPSAKNDLFIQLAADAARHAALKPAADVAALLASPFVGDPSKTLSGRFDDVIGVIRENMKLHRFQRVEGQTGGYVHHDGTLGVLIQVEGGKGELQMLRDVCMHVAAKTPAYLRREDVPADVVSRETEIAKEQIAQDPKNKNKPAEILTKIAEGKLKTWYAENVLLEQPFVKEESKTVGQLLGGAGLKLVRVIRYKVGERS